MSVLDSAIEDQLLTSEPAATLAAGPASPTSRSGGRWRALRRGPGLAGLILLGLRGR